MDNDRQVMNIRVPKELVDRMERHIELINKSDKLGRILTRSSLVRALMERELEENGHE